MVRILQSFACSLCVGLGIIMVSGSLGTAAETPLAGAASFLAESHVQYLRFQDPRPGLESPASDDLWAARDSGGQSAPSSIAEQYLHPLARSAKVKRVLGGTVSLAASAVVVGVGMSIRDDTAANENAEAAGDIVIGMGVLGGVLSLYQLMAPSRPEREYANAVRIEDLSSQNAAAASALKSMADRAHRSRITSGVVSSLLGAYFLAVRPYKTQEIRSSGYYIWTDEEDSPYNDYAGALWMVSGLYSLAIPSAEERTFQRFRKNELSGSGSSISFGPCKNGKSYGIAALMSF